MILFKLLSKKTIKTGIMIFLVLVFLIAICKGRVTLIDRIMDKYEIFNVIQQRISSAFPGDHNSVRYLLGAIISSVATILTLILTIPLILLQSIYKHAKITEFFLRRIEIIQLLSFMFFVIIVSSLVLLKIDDSNSSIESGTNLTGTVYFLAFYSTLLFIFLFPLIYDYWRFCARFLNSRGLLGIIREERPRRVESHLKNLGIVFEVLKKSLDEGNIEAIREGCDYIRDIFVQLYQQFTDENRGFIFKNLRDVAKKSIESGPEILGPFMNLFVRFMTQGFEQNEHLPYFEKILQLAEPIVVEALRPGYEEAIDDYFRRLMRFELSIRRTHDFDAALACIHVLRNHQMRIISEWRSRFLGVVI